MRILQRIVWGGVLLAGIVALAASGGRADKKGVDAPAGAVTFNREIAPILFANCSACHRPGEVAPFALLSYDDVSKRGELVRTVISERIMPPWKSVGETHGVFVGERRLSREESALFERWFAAGMPEGDPQDLPPLPEFKDGWKLGTPDIVLTMPEEFQVPAEGNDIYRNFVFPLTLPEGKYIRALEYHPSNRAVVHHAAFSFDRTEKSRRADEADPAPGFKGSLVLPGTLFPGSLSAWVPGRDPLPLPEGFSIPWPTGTDLVLQLHLHPSGKPEVEQSTIGLYLTDQAPKRSVIDLNLIHVKIDIPPGESHYPTHDEYVLPLDLDLYGIFPHMHLIGRKIQVSAARPGEDPAPLLTIDDWDFNWQSFYQFKSPVRLPAGTRLILDGVHDNSADNFRNPFDPPRRMTFGEQTTNEMSVAMMQLSPVREEDLSTLGRNDRRRLNLTVSAASTPSAGGIDADQAMRKYDTDGDGRLSVAEMSAASGKNPDRVAREAQKYDVDGDGGLNLEELRRALRDLKQ